MKGMTCNFPELGSIRHFDFILQMNQFREREREREKKNSDKSLAVK